MLRMVRCPPHRVALRRAPADERHQRLERPRSAKRPVREIAVVEAGDGEHADQERTGCDSERDRAPACPEHGEDGDVHGKEWQAPRPVHAIPGPRGPGSRPAVEPSPQPKRAARRPITRVKRRRQCDRTARLHAVAGRRESRQRGLRASRWRDVWRGCGLQLALLVNSDTITIQNLCIKCVDASMEAVRNLNFAPARRLQASTPAERQSAGVAKARGSRASRR